MPATPQVFTGIRVTELGGSEAGAYCGKLFADFGANVVKIEPLGGDPARREGILVDRGDGVGESGVFAWLNTNKQSVILDPADTARLREIVAACDVLIDSRPRAGEDEGETGHAALRALNPALIIEAITWFGDSGPYRDFVGTDAVVRALAGAVKAIGPVEVPAIQPEHQSAVPAGLSAFTAAVAALIGERAKGPRYEISIHDANCVLTEYQAANVEQNQAEEIRRGINRAYPSFPMGIYECREGWLGISVLTPNQWADFCDMLDLPEMAVNPRYEVLTDRFLLADELEAIFAPLLKARTAREWFEEGLRRFLPFVVCPDTAELLAEPVHRIRGAFGAVEIGKAKFEAPVLPQHLGATPPKPNGRAALAGADTVSWRPSPATRHPTGAGDALPLAGIRIVDLCMGWAGTVATRQIADLGAEVIKIESRSYPDWWRGSPYTDEANAQSAHELLLGFNMVNRNKLGVTLDLTRPEGANILLRLVASANAVTQNYSSGVLPKLGLAYQDLVKVNPNLIMLSMPAFGSETPWTDLRAYGSTLEQASGLPLVTGREDWIPTMNHVAYGDPLGGLNGAASLITALYHQKQTGQGQHVEMSAVEALFPMVAPWIIEQSITGKTRPRRGARHAAWAPHGVYRCAGEDSWAVIAVHTDSAWQALCAAIGRPDLAADPALATAPGRKAHEDRIDAAITAWTQTRSDEEVMETLQARGVSAGAARSYGDLMWREPHHAARGYWQWIERPYVGLHPQPSSVFREEGAPMPVRWPTPTLGQHGREVLSRILGFSEAELDRLEADRIIGETPIPMSERAPRSAEARRQAANA